METYKIELTEEEITVVNATVLAGVLACVKHDDLENASLLSRVGLKLGKAKDKQD